MAAIPWQNVNGPSLDGASRYMEGATRSANNMFDVLANAINQREAANTAAYDKGTLNNTQAFLNRMAQYRTPEELQAAQKSGVLDQLRKGYGDQVDQAVIRTAEDGRNAILQGRVEQDTRYKNMVQDEKDAPARDQLKAAILRGDGLTANILESGSPNMRNMAELAALRNTTERQGVLDRRSEIEAGRKDKLFPGELTAQTDTHNTSVANLGRSNAETDLKNQELGFTKALTNAQGKFRGQQEADRQRISSVSQALGIPLNEAGVPNFSGVSATVMENFKKAVGPVASSSVAQADFERQAVEAGMPATKLAEIQKLYPTMFPSGTTLSPADEDRFKAQLELRNAAHKSKRANNLFVTGTEEEKLQDGEKVADYVRKNMKDGPWTQNRLIADLNGYMDKGMQVDGVNMQIPPKLMLDLTKKFMERSSLVVNTSPSLIEEGMSDLMKTPEFRKMLSESGELQADPTNAKGVAALRETFLNKKGAQIAPDTVMSDLLANLAARAAKVGGGTDAGGVIPKK